MASDLPPSHSPHHYRRSESALFALIDHLLRQAYLPKTIRRLLVEDEGCRPEEAEALVERVLASLNDDMILRYLESLFAQGKTWAAVHRVLVDEFEYEFEQAGDMLNNVRHNKHWKSTKTRTRLPLFENPGLWQIAIGIFAMLFGVALIFGPIIVQSNSGAGTVVIPRALLWFGIVSAFSGLALFIKGLAEFLPR